MVDVEARVRMFRSRIVSCIRGPSVILHLIPNIKELESDVGTRLKLRLSSDDISAVSSPVDELIDIIIQSKQPGKWQAFCEALEQSEYPHLVTLLTTNSDAIYSMDHEPKIIQLFAPAIVKRIHAADIVSDLGAKNIVNNDDKENILARHRTQGPTAAAVLLLDRMQCRTSPKYWYPVFLHALMQHDKGLVKDIDPDFYNCPSQYQPENPSDAIDMDMDSSSSCSPSKIAKMMCSDEVDCCGSVDENIMTDHEDASMNDLSTPPGQDSQTSLLSDSTSMYYSSPMSMKKEVDEGNLCSQDTKLLTEKQLNIPLDVESKHEAREKTGLLATQRRRPQYKRYDQCTPSSFVSSRNTSLKTSANSEIRVQSAVIKGFHKYKITLPKTNPPIRLHTRVDIEYTNVRKNIYGFDIFVPCLEAFHGGDVVGHPPIGFTYTFHCLFGMNCSIFAEVTGAPVESFPPWPLMQMKGGGWVIPCNYIISCHSDQKEEVFEMLRSCLEKMREGKAMSLQLD